ncbi:MAG: glycosyltransferase family A protein, partial [Thermoplasmata archaeon]
RRTYLRGAVESVLSQTLPRSDYETVVLKDFADPEIDAWLRTLGPSVRNVTEELPEVGQMLARGAALARGEVICFLDDDDRFRPEKLAGLRALFRDDPTLGLVRNAYDPVDSDGRPLPSWQRFRPQPPTSATWGPGHGRVAFPWLHRYGGYVNLSSMAIRTGLARRWTRWLEQVPASTDVVLFTLALASAVGVRVDSARWTEYRVHSSTSHPTIADLGDPAYLREFRRSLASASLLRSAVASVAPPPDATRLSDSWWLETATVVFLLDPSARLAPADWVRLAVSAFRRRQAYLGTMWLYCLYRWVRPLEAARAYGARRSEELRRSAGRASTPGGP